MPMIRPTPHHPSSRFVIVAVATVAWMLSTGATAQSPRVPAAVDIDLLYRAADTAYTRIADRARKAKSLDTDRVQYASARRLVLPLMAYASSIAPVAIPWVWGISVETRETPIAYCLPGGKIMLSTGLVDRTKLTPAEVSVVIAHVIAHALAGKDAELAMSRLAGQRASPDPNRTMLQLADILENMVQNDVHDMAEERAADVLSLELMARSGVDPRYAAEAWRKIARAGGASPPAFLALHPTWSTRVEEIEAQIAAMVPIYEKTLAEQASRPKDPPVEFRPPQRR